MAVSQAFDHDSSKASCIGNRLIEWFVLHDRGYPWRKTSDPFAVLVAEILLLQTNAGKVAGAWEHILRQYPNPSALAAADPDVLHDVIRPLGFSYRAKVLTDIGRQICEQYHSIIPSDVETLSSIKGIGGYIASAVACFAFSQPVAVVDTNVVRVMRRVHGLETKSIAKIAKTYSTESLRSHPPKEYNWAIIDFGALVCKNKKPRCTKCILSDLCFQRIQDSSESVTE